MDFNKENINDPISISFKTEYETYNLSEYISCRNPLRSRIETDKRSENALIRDYSGRELYEIIQNADDQHAMTIEIELDNSNRLHIRNDGGRPFSNKGLLSVMRPHQSWKRDESKNKEGPIGNKGLEIRSLLNWSDGMTIHSNGVKIAFSSTIASKKWKQIVTKTPTLLELEKENNCPLAILSVPEVTKDDITSDTENVKWTTEIEISCHFNVIEDIISKMETLHAEVLLFLKHVRNVIMIINGRETKLSRRDDENQTEDNRPSFFALLTEGSTDYRYAVFQKMIRMSDKSAVERDCIVSVAYPTDSERYCDYLYSYFPTEIPLRLPCVVHADFELTMSRNALTKCNQNIVLMKEAGSILVRAAEYRAKDMIGKNFDLDRLLPLKMLSPDDASCQLLPNFSNSIEIEFDSCHVIPTIDGKYKSFNDHIYYHPQVDMSRFSSKFRKDSLLNNYISEETNEAVKKKNRIPEKLAVLHRQLSELAYDLDMEELSNLIIDLLNVKDWDKMQRPNVLKLDTDYMLNAKESVFVLESKDVTDVLKDKIVHETVAPRELNLNILHPLLSKLLLNRLRTDSRGLTRTLKGISEAQDADFSRVKEEIEKRSKTMTEKNLNGVIRWLYNRWIRRGKTIGSGNKDSAPMCGVFQLFNADGVRKPVCSLLLNSDDRRFLISETHLEAIPEDDRIMFFIDYLGCAQAFPLEPYDFSKDVSYLDTVMPDEKRTSVYKNIALIPANEFIHGKAKEIILALIIKDRRFLKSLKDGTEISFVYYSDRTFRSSLSYAAYWLTRDNGTLADIKNYVIPTTDLFDTSILNSGIINHNKLKDVNVEELENLLMLLGAKTDPLKLTFAQLYKILEQHNNPSTANRVYKEIRALMLRKEKELHEEASLEEKDILKTVWAIGPGDQKERRPKQEVYYWDNTRLPKKYLSSLWKICLGSRTGEQSVHRLFGVKLLSDLNLHVVGEEDYDRGLTQQVKDFLIARFKYLVATSLSDGEYKIETIRSKASDIRNLISSLRISHSFSYEMGGQTMKASYGDTVRDKGIFYICSEVTTFEEAIDDPQLCTNLAGGLCLALKLEGENEWKFSHIIQASQKSIDYEWSELDDTLCDDIIRAIGVQDKEKQFWNQLGICLDESDIDQEQKRAKIFNRIPNIILPANLTDIEDMEDADLYNLLKSLNDNQRKKLKGLYSLDEFYCNQMKCYFSKIYSSVRSHTYHKMRIQLKSARAIEDIYKWVNYLDTFRSKILDYIDRQNDLEFKDLSQLSHITLEYINDLYPKLHLDKELLENELSEPFILESNLNILKKYNVAEGELTYKDKAIGYFEGFEKEFEEIVAKHTASSQSVIPICNTLERSNASISFSTTSKRKGRGSGKGGFISSQTQERIGKSAEQRVKTYLESHPNLYDSITDVSENHEYHCDLIYKRKGNPIQRHLEIKCVNGGKIFFSSGEIEEGKQNSSTYDLALVHGDKISIIPNAFIENSELLSNLSPSSYEVSITIGDDN